MSLNSWNEVPAWNRPDSQGEQRSMLNQVMDIQSQEISLSELDNILDTIDSREWIKWKIIHFIEQKSPYIESFSYIGVSNGGVLLYNERSREYFVIEIIEGKILKTTLPNMEVRSWSDPWDIDQFEYIDFGFMFHIKTWSSAEERRRIFFRGLWNWFADRKK